MEFDEDTEVVLSLPEDIHRLCRTCMSVSTDKMQLCHDIPIFKDFLLTEAGEMLKICSAVKVTPNDGLPMSICDNCAAKLEIAYSFKTQSEKTDESLRKILELPPINYNSTSTSDIKENEINNRLNVILYKNNLYDEETPTEIIKQIDLTPLIQQRHVLEKYLDDYKIEDVEEQVNKLHNDNDILNLIEERKTYDQNILEDTKFEYIELINENDFKAYECSICKLIYTDKTAFNKHVLTCGKEVTKVESDNKIRKAYKRKCIKRSVREMFVKEIFVCDICEKTFQNESKLAAHFYNHAITFGVIVKEETDLNININNKISCDLCAEVFENHQDLIKHEKLMHKKMTDLNCTICNKTFLREVDLVAHLKIHGIKIVYCRICCKKFDDAKQLQNHIKSHSDIKKSFFTCPLCQKLFPNLETLTTHSTIHLSESYKCERCKRTFNNCVTFKHHVKQHTDPKFLCSICGKQYFSRVTLKCHLRSHSNEKPFKCSICNKAFSSRATLSVHKRIHSEIKPYSCSYCGYSCRQSGDLAMHIRTHTGDKPYKCTFPDCDRKFTTSSQRKEHYRRHTNERNHKCKDCGKAFLESKTLKVHMLTHTGEKPHCCEVCGRKFRRSHHLANHIKMHTNCNSGYNTNYVINLEDVQILGDDNIVNEEC